MEEMKLRIQVVTPAFVTGADQTGVEIRAASIKGQIRWWWRALHSELDVRQLGVEEGRIFGSSEMGLKSSIRIGASVRSPLKVIPRGESAPRSGATYSYRRGGRTGEADVLPYLGYGPIRLLSRAEKEEAKKKGDRAFLDGRNEPKRGVVFIRPAVAPGTEFDIRLTWPATGRSSTPDDGLVRALAAWLALGGLGTRSRKGFGSLRLLEATQAGRDGKVVTDELERLIEEYRNDGAPLPGDVPAWPSAVHRRVHRTAPCDSWQEALGRVGLAYKERRPKGDSRWIGGDASPRRASSLLLSVAFDGAKYRGQVALLPATQDGTRRGAEVMMDYVHKFAGWRV